MEGEGGYPPTNHNSILERGVKKDGSEKETRKMTFFFLAYPSQANYMNTNYKVHIW